MPEAAEVVEPINTYVIQKSWVLTARLIAPVAATVMVWPTRSFSLSPPDGVGAAVLIGYGVAAGLIGTSIVRRRDIA